MIAFVYWNLHKQCWSVRVNRKVIAHATEVLLTDGMFKVSEAGRQRVLAERRKNVHAGVQGRLVGYLAPLGNELEWLMLDKGDTVTSVTYNPYKYDSFVIRGTMQPVYTAQAVYMTANRQVLAQLTK